MLSLGNKAKFCVTAAFLTLFSLQMSQAAWGQSGVNVLSQRQADARIVEELPAIDLATQYLTRGVARRALDRREEALIDLTLAINQHALPAPDQARALYNRGSVLEDMGDKNHAIADYEGALRLDPAMLQASTRLNVLRGPSPSDVIQLKPPVPSSEAPIILRPPTPRAEQRVSLTPPSDFAAPALKPAISENRRSGDAQIQLGAWRTESEADQAWELTRMRVGDLLAEYAPIVVAANIPGKGLYYRLRLGFMDRARAQNICTALKARSQDCLVVQ